MFQGHLACPNKIIYNLLYISIYKGKIMEILIVKLVTGEEILGEKWNDGSGADWIKLKNPVGVAVVRGKDGQPSVGFAPFPLHAEPKSGEVVAFQSQHVVYSYEPAEDFRTNYEQLFGTGIILPKQQNIITG